MGPNQLKWDTGYGPLSLFQKQQGDLATLSFQLRLGVSSVLERPHNHSDRLCTDSIFPSDSLAILNSVVAGSKNDS